MATPSVALATIRRTVRVSWPDIATKEARAFLVQTAKAGHRKIMSEAVGRAGIEPTWIAYGDAPGTPIESAKQRIVYRYYYVREILNELLRMLRAASPVGSGAYRNAHEIYVDGRPIAAGAIPLIRPGQELMIANSMPYARRLEVGKTEAGRDFLISVPNRIYERTAQSAMAKFKNTAKVSFGYVTLPAAHIHRGHPGHGLGTKSARRRRVAHKGEEVRAPAIFIGGL